MALIYFSLLLLLVDVSSARSLPQNNNTYDFAIDEVHSVHHVVSDTHSAFAPIHRIGGQGGTKHMLYGGTNGKILKQIVVWAEGTQIKAIQITLTDTDPVTFGNPSGISCDYSFETGETITQLSLWGNGKGTRLGAIYFETSSSGKFDISMTVWAKKTEYKIDVASGICVGVMLNSGADIDNAGFIFLNEVDSASLENLRYPQMSFNMGGIAPETLEHFGAANHQSAPIRWVFSDSISVSVIKSWSMSVGVESFMKLRVKGGVPELAEGQVDLGWKLTFDRTWGQSETETKVLSWNEAGELGSGQSLSLDAVTTKGEITTPYEGVMVITMKSGDVFRYLYKGMYNGVSFTEVRLVDY